MNAYNRRYFTALLPCCHCGLEPMRVYCDATDRYAVKCDCGRRTKGFTTIAGASRSWNNMNKKSAVRESTIPTGGRGKKYMAIIEQNGRAVKL